MDPEFRKTHGDIIRLHEEEENIKSLSAARQLGIKVRRIDRTFSPSSSPVNFKPPFFIPPKGDKLSTYHRCAKCASCAAPSSPSSSLSTLPNRLSLSRSFSAWSSSRRFSFSSTRSSPACETEVETAEESPGREEQEPLDCEHGETYPYMIRSLAEMKGIEPPAPPKAARQPVLTANGPVMKGKLPRDEAVELHEDDEWKVTQVLEDTTYNNPHAIVEIVIRAHGYTDGSFLTANEIKAIVRVMKLRMDMRQYRRHGCCPPVLALSYVATMSGNDTEYRSARILQAYHDGRQLVIQYSERFDLSNAQRAAVSLEKFLRYYFCEPVKTAALTDKKDEELWKVLQSWSAIKKRYHMDPKKDSEYEKGDKNENDGVDSETKHRSFRHWFNKLLTFV